ncbi:alanine racemase [Aliikangiella coralliicola]|uniref:Alanine racemase n=1 Tax=Aliikangiella coralliicola TaxID=2592383 RepID=A0A545TWB0_9GAMM|nr:alanine racemase [Aliikangiella coralliicola]TQV81451.1 alanine racemase [Aliikangiella coralliicola]
MRSTKAVINLAAIQHNLSVVRLLAPGTGVMAVVKADAYGHGIVQVAEALTDVEAIAVACLDEAIKLREAQIKNPIILLEGFFSQNELELSLKYDLQTVVHQQSQIDSILALKPEQYSQKKLKVWLKLDSGMNRLGFTVDDYSAAYSQLSNSVLIDSINLMSHLACADDITNPMNQAQIGIFKEATQSYTGLRSMANSAGVVAWPESHFNWIRPGIILYGCSPMVGYQGQTHGLKPAMTLQSQLFAIRNLSPGDKVGYGSAWRAKEKTRVGVIAIGYGDGYPRHAREGTPVLINGKKYPLVGKVSMDMLTVDLGNDDQLSIGDKAILWGKGLPVETIADCSDTIPYTLLCGVTSRVKFEWVTKNPDEG